MELFKKIERLSAEQLLSVIREFDCETSPSYEYPHATFYVQSQEELACEDEEIIEDYIDRMCLYCTDPGYSTEYPFCDDHMNLGMGYECPDCGKETQPEYAYCPFCGYDLGGHHASLP